MEGLVASTKCQNWHTSCKDYLYPLARFPAPLPFFPSLGAIPESPWEDDRSVVFLSKGKDQSDSSPHMEKTPMVPDSFASTSFFAVPVRLPPIDPLPDEKRCLPLFVSGIPPLPSSASVLPPSVVFPPLFASVIPSPVSFSPPPSPLFSLSVLPVVAPLLPEALLLPLVFVLRAPTRTFHCQSLTSKQN